YTPGQLVVLKRNPNYWKQDTAGTQLPYLEELRFLVVQRTEAQTAQFLAGHLDQLNISRARFAYFQDQEPQGRGVHLGISDSLFGSPPHIAINCDDPVFGPLFSNHEFRRAMEFAVNRERVIEDVYNGLATLPGTPTAPANGAFYEDTTGLFNMFDLEAAAAALDALGVVDSDGDGIRNMPNGGPNLQFGPTYASDSQAFTDIATIIQNDFGQIGVRVDLVAVQNAALLSTGLAGDYQSIIVAL